MSGNVRLTGLAKTMITLIVLGIVGSVLWNMYGTGLGDRIQGLLGNKSDVAGAQSSNERGQSQTTPAQNSTSKGAAALGTSGNPLKVSLVSFHGYAPALLANGSSLTTQAGSIFARKNLKLEVVIQDDIPTLTTIFESGAAQCAWRTSDFWAQEQPNLRNAGLDAKAVMIVDNTRGADAIISNKADIRSVEDLAGRSVALLEFTPSHGMIIDAIDNSSMSARKKTSVKYVFINAEEGTAGVRAALESGSVDAAVLWDPDLSLAARATKSHTVYSTKTASNLIFDVIVCDQRVLDTVDGQAAVQKLVAGWMEGVDAARANPDAAVDALVKTEEFFTLLAKDEGSAFVKSLFDNLVWTNLADNARILGMSGDTNHYERVYRRFDQIYRGVGALANPNSPVINPQDSFDYRFLRQLGAGSSAVAAQSKPEVFTQQARDQATANSAIVTKPVLVSFSSGSAQLTKRAQKIIDDEMVPFIENNGAAYFEISGNSDSTGSRAANVSLSFARANAVLGYLTGQWEFPTARFKVVGNGPDRPLCNEASPASEGLDLEACRGVNRSTRIAVFEAR